MALLFFGRGEKAEKVIIRDEVLFKNLNNTSWFRAEVVPKKIFSVWPSRATPAPLGWKEDPLILCQPKACPLLQRLCPISTMFDPELSKDLRYALGGIMKDAGLIIRHWQPRIAFACAYKSFVVEVLALCIALEDEEGIIPESKITLRFKLYTELLGHLARVNDQIKKESSRPDFANNLSAAISSVFSFSTWFHAHTLFQYWLLKTELRLGPRISTWVLRGPKLKVSEQAAAYSLSHFSEKVIKSYSCIIDPACFQAVAQHPHGLATDTYAAYDKSSIRGAIAASSLCSIPSYSGKFKDTLTFHDQESCPQSDCEILLWNTEHFKGYRSLQAITLDLTPEGHLNSVPVSRNCMIVSHAVNFESLSFGRGISSCMHELFARIARRFDCDSYYLNALDYVEPWKPNAPWSVDIGPVKEETPEKNELADRLVFEEIRYAIVYDPHVIQFASPGSSQTLLESIAFILLTSAWSWCPITRVQTASLANCMHILFKNGETLPLGHFARLLLDNASLEIAILLRTNEAITRYATLPSEAQQPRDVPLHYEPPDFEQVLSILSSIRYETSLNLTRSLWIQLHQTLLATNPLPEEDRNIGKLDFTQGADLSDIAELFWRIHSDSRQFMMLPARWLISATPRINKFGLSWAPISPLHDTLDQKFLDQGWRFYHSGPVMKGSKVEVQQGSLKGPWRTIVYPSDTFDKPKCRASGKGVLKRKVYLRFKDILRTYGQGFLKVAVVQAMGNSDDIDGVDVYGIKEFVVDPEEEPSKEYTVCGLKKGRMVGVLATNNEVAWSWRGVYVWEMNVPLPESKVKWLTIV